MHGNILRYIHRSRIYCKFILFFYRIVDTEIRESAIPTIPCDKVIQIRFNGNSYKSNLFDGYYAYATQIALPPRKLKSTFCILVEKTVVIVDKMKVYWRHKTGGKFELTKGTNLGYKSLFNFE